MKRKLKLVLVGDHTVTQNWGGRAQTLALRQLLEEEFEISGTIDAFLISSNIADDGYVKTFMPIQFINFCLRLRERFKPIDWYMQCEEKLGSRDFVGVDSEESVGLVIKYKRRNPGLNEIYEKIKAADIVVANGEGSGIFTTPHRRDFHFYQVMLELGVRLGKPAFYVNGILSECPYAGLNQESLAGARQTLSKCKAVLVRDPESLTFARKHMPKVNAAFIPDALFAWMPVYEQHRNVLPANGDFIIGPPEQADNIGKLDFSAPYICIGGGSGAALAQQKAVSAYAALAKALKTIGCNVYLTQNCGGDHFMQQVARQTGLGLVPWSTPIFMAGAVLAKAEVFISGRYHPTIHASLGGTPCVFLEAHSHKMHSLQEMLGYTEREVFSSLPTADEIWKIVARTQGYMANNGRMREERKAIVAGYCDAARTIAREMVKQL